MFPLGSVLLPSMVLPLHVFEPRYRAMIEVVLASEEKSFGVVLIERGHEVGGNDQRSGIGTLARVIDTQQADDGRWAVVSVGTDRIRVDEWLEDDPYPQAMVSDWPDESLVSDTARDSYAAILAKHRRLLGLASEAGYDVGPVQELTDDPIVGSFQVAAVAPISSYDRQRLLSAPSIHERFPMLVETLDTAVALVEMELSQTMFDEGGESSS